MEAVLFEYLRFFVVPVNTRARRGHFCFPTSACGVRGEDFLQRERRVPRACRGSDGVGAFPEHRENPAGQPAAPGYQREEVIRRGPDACVLEQDKNVCAMETEDRKTSGMGCWVSSV